MRPMHLEAADIAEACTIALLAALSVLSTYMVLVLRT